ncbi:MAG TPA: NUDIX hydrolase [Candidatus Saccharimonadales bacterium]|nr:NUDIX hydrolase [Candidatus Saccharimonadales bacterium]
MRIIVRNIKGEVLLVKSVLGMTEWELPGGEVRRSETELAAIARELKEETALIILEDTIKKRRSLLQPFPLELFECIEPITANAQIKRPWEIREIRWCNPQELPIDTAGYVTSFFMK